MLFTHVIHSKESLKTYTWGLKKFMEFYKLKDYDGLASMDSKMLQIMVEDFVMSKKGEGLSRSGIRNHTCPLQVFCEQNDLDIKWKKINRLLPQQGKKSGGKPYTTEQIQKMLSFERDTRNKAMIHFISASGVRVGAISDLKLKHVIDFKEGCKLLTIYPDTKDEYNTFLTPEASNALDFYLEKRRNDKEYLTDDSPVFRTHYRLKMEKVKPMKRGSIIAVVNRVIRRARLRVGKSAKRYDTQIDHGFRKRWTTIVENTEGMKIISAEKMQGHHVKSVPMAEFYNLPSPDLLFAEYKKAIPELTIDDSARKQAELDKANVEKSELQNANKKLKSSLELNTIAMEKMVEMGFKMQKLQKNKR